MSDVRREPARPPKQSDLETRREDCEPLGPYRPHISTTPRDETDTEQHVCLKVMEICDETDAEQPMEGFF